MTMIPAILIVLAAQGAASTAPADIPEPTPSAMSKSEIREHNSKLDRTHPYYIRCVKAPDTGSLVARRQTCRTNAQWAPFDRAGADQARDMGDEARSRSASSSSN